MPEAQRGGPRPGGRPDGRFDGRLDLDDLDAPLDLDVIGADPDRPLLAEHVRRILESTGLAPFVRRHRTAVVAAGLTTAVVLGSAGWWWASRPVPLPDAPQILVKTSGPDRTQATIDPGDGRVAGLTLDVAVASVERAGVAVELLTLTGPGLSPPRSGRVSLVDTSRTDSVATVSAALDCTTPESVRAAMAAEATDFGVVVRRTAPEGESRDDRVRLVGAQRLAQVVRSTCLQAAAGRELTVTSVTAVPLDGLAAADVDVTVENRGDRAWPALRTSTRALPWLVNGKPSSDLAPGGTVALRARLWLEDCGHPSAALSDGLELRTNATTEDAEPNAPDNVGNTFFVPVDAAARARVDDAFSTMCSITPPVATVTQAAVRTGGTDTSAGTVELVLRVRAPGAAVLEVAPGGAAAGGVLSQLDSPVRLADGTGVLHARWELPSCTDLLAAGVPRFAVDVVPVDGSGGERRPYLMPLGGEALRIELTRVCGPDAADLVP